MPKKSTLDSILANLEKGQKKDVLVNTFSLAEDKSAVYVGQQETSEKNFVETLLDADPNTYGPLMDKSLKGYPIFFYLVSENNSKETKVKRALLFSNCVKAFVVHVKNKRTNRRWEASTTNSFIRRFLVHLKLKYNIHFSLKNDFNFKGSFVGKNCPCSFFIFVKNTCFDAIRQ